MRKHMAKPFMKAASPGVPGLQWMSIGHPKDDETMSILTFRDQDKNEFRAAVSDLSIAQLIAGLINAAGRAFAARAKAAGKPSSVPDGTISITATGLGLATETTGPMLMIRSGGVDLYVSVDKDLLVDTCQKVVDQADQIPETTSPAKRN